MKILIFPVQYPREGSYQGAYVHARAKIYRKLGHDIHVFVPSRLAQSYNFEGVEVEQGSYSRLISCLRKFCPDVIATHNPTIFMQHHSSKIFKDLPTVVWMHGFQALMTVFHNLYAPWEIKNKVYYLIVDPIKLFVLRKFLHKVYAIVYVSQWMQRITEFYTLFRHKNSLIIPNPIDISLFKPADKKEKKFKRGVSVRSLGWKYGLDIAIKAYSHLDQTSLTIIGTSPPQDPGGKVLTILRNLATKYHSNSTFVVKAINHNLMPTIYQNYEYFVNTSRTEAQGVAMCEAMACGLPVIATNIGGTPEFVIHGFNGLLAPPKPVAIRNAITKILDDSVYRKLSHNARRFVVKNLEAKNLCQKEVNLMEKAIAGDQG